MPAANTRQMLVSAPEILMICPELCRSSMVYDLEGEDDDLRVTRGVALDAGVAVSLKTCEGWERDLLFPRVLQSCVCN